MKLITFFLFLGLFQVSGATFGQRETVTFQLDQLTVDEVFSTIRKQLKYDIFFSNEELDVSREIRLSSRKMSVELLLKEILQGRYSYEFIEKTIVIRPVKEKKESRLLIRGCVKDKNGIVLPGVTVLLKGATLGVATDTAGMFTLELAKRENIVLLFSFVGMEMKEVVYKGEKFLNVVLYENEEHLGEVVVTGYQTISKERSTGAYNIVKREVVERSHASDLSTALLGTTAGMQGKENEDGSIDYLIRGMTSLYADYQPLVVVDGFPVANGFRDINPNDVESVTVLKDAAAASIWGARSANGVIVVVTRKSKMKGKVQVEANALVRIGRKLDLSTVLTTASSEDQVFYEKLAFDNGWISPVGDVFSYLNTSMSLAKEYMYDYSKGKIQEEVMNKGLDELRNRNNRGQIKQHLLESPITQQYNLSISNSTDRAKNYMSIMYENTGGNVISNNTDRWRINFNNQSNVFKWLDVNIGVNIHYVDTEFSGPTMGEISSLSPYEMLLNEDGSYGRQLVRNRDQLAKIPAGVLPYDDWSYNLLREVRAREYTKEELNTRLQVGVLLRLTEGLSFDSKFQYELNRMETELLHKEDSYFVRDRVNMLVDYNQTTKTVNAQFLPKGGILRSSVDKVKNYSWRNQLNVMRSFKERHDINGVVGFEVSQFDQVSRINPCVYGYDSDKKVSSPLPFGTYSVNKNGQKVQIKDIVGQNQSAIYAVNVENDLGTETVFTSRVDRFVSVYGNLSYTFDRKYGLSGSFRSDASNFISDKASYRWAPLWSIGGLWNVHQEKFMHLTESWLKMFNVRLTYGFNGNVETSTSPVTLVSESSLPSAVTGLPTTVISSRGNPHLAWEKTSTVNFGIDFSMFSNRFFGNIDIYRKRGKDIIGNISLPAVLGAPVQLMNNAKLSNKGIEITLGTNVEVLSGIDFSTKLTYAYNKNEIIGLHHPVYHAGNVLGGSFVEGYPTQSVWAVEYLGMEDGIAYVEGPEGTKVSMDDMSMVYNGDGLRFLKYMGPATDPHSLGWSGVLSGYGFSFSFLLTGKFGGYFRAPTFYSSMNSEEKNVVNRFVREVIEGSDRIPGWQPADRMLSKNWDYYTSRLNTLVESSSFVKLKELSLEYSLPRGLMKKLKLNGVKFYGQVRNLGCLWTANRYDYDPEWRPGSFKPTTTYALGLTINL